MNLKQFLFVNHSSHQILVKNTFWLGLIEVFSKLIMFFVTITIGRYLGIKSFGTYNYVFSFVAIIMIFSDLGVSTVITRDIARHPDQAGNYLGNALSLRLLTSLFIIILMSLSLFFFKRDSQYLFLIILATFYSLLQQFSALFVVILTAFEKMEFVFVTRIFFFVGILLSTLVVVDIHGSLSLLIVLNSVVSIISIIVTIYLIKQQQIVIVLQWQSQFILEILRQILPIFGFIACTQIYLNLDTLLIGKFFGDQTVGVYQAAYKILFAFQSINIINNAILPRISILVHQQKYATLVKLYKVVIVISLLILIPLATIISLNSRIIVTLIWPGSGYLAAATILPFMIWAGVINFFRNFATNYLLACNQQQYIFFAILIGLIVNSALNFFIMPTLGYSFAAVSLLISEVIILGVSLYFSFKNSQ